MTDYNFVPGKPAIGDDVGGTPYNPPGSQFGPWLNDILRRGAAQHWQVLESNTTATVEEHGVSFDLAGYTLALDPADELNSGWFAYAAGPGTIAPDGETPVSLAQGEWMRMSSDGTEVRLQRSNSGSFDVAISLERPRPGIEFPVYPLSVACVFPENFSGSHSVARVPATSEQTFSIRKNGVEFGTLVFAAEAETGVFVSDETEFAPGDVLSVVSPDPRDPTLAGVGVTLQGAKR